MMDLQKEAKLEEHVDIAIVVGTLLLALSVTLYAIGEHEKSVVRPCRDAAAQLRR